jgi:peptide/nickel transport system permease protein
MLKVLALRLSSLLLTLFIISLAIFVILEVLPGDPAAIMLGTSSQPDTLAALRHQMGLDQPALVRYVAWIGGVLTGNFGNSYSYGVPVSGLIAERLTVTAPLTVMAITLSLSVALPLGVFAAAKQRGAVDVGATLFSQLGIAIPNFWIGLLLILFFSLTLGWFPAGGFRGWGEGIWPGIKSLILPAIALAIPQSAILTRVTRSAVLDVMNEDFVRTARAKGVSRNRALWRHAVPNALVPVVTILGLQISVLLAGAVLVENVFSLPGMGRLAYQALAQRDLVVIKNVVLLFAGIVILVNLIVDAAYIVLDPRLREPS